MATGGTILPQKRIDRPVPVKESAKRSQPLCPITARVRRKCRIASHRQRNQAKAPLPGHLYGHVSGRFPARRRGFGSPGQVLEHFPARTMLFSARRRRPAARYDLRKNEKRQKCTCAGSTRPAEERKPAKAFFGGSGRADESGSPRPS